MLYPNHVIEQTGIGSGVGELDWRTTNEILRGVT